MLSRTSQYAIRAVLLMAAEPNKNHGAAETARRVAAPPNYRGKILRLLADAGVLASSRGSGGGFRLAKPADAIRLLDVVEPIDRVSRWTKCFLGMGFCQSDHPCPIHPVWLPIREQYLNLLQSKYIADIPADPARFTEFRAAFAPVGEAIGFDHDEPSPEEESG